MGWNNFPENWETDGVVIEVLEEDRIPKELHIGEKYHCSWASSKAMVWVLKDINGSQVILETPRTKKQIQTNVSSLRVLNKVAMQNARKRIKNKKHE